MTDPTITYQPGFKYQLRAPFHCDTAIRGQMLRAQFVELMSDGRLVLETGFAWDGLSGPLTMDTPNSMRGSAVHDALYRLMRRGGLSHNFKTLADQEMFRRLIEDGMWRFRANYLLAGVEKFGNPSTRPSGERPILVAP